MNSINGNLSTAPLPRSTGQTATTTQVETLPSG